MLRSGARWRDCPADYGPYTTIYNRFNRWRKAGVWDKLMDAIIAAHDGKLDRWTEFSAEALPSMDPTRRLARLTPNSTSPLGTDPGVADAAAKALGRLGHLEARARLIRLLDERPDADVIEALALVADEDCTIRLGRAARRHPSLRDAAIGALEAIDTPRANIVLAGLGNRDDAPD